MTSPWKKQPELVVDTVLKRAEVSKIVRKLQGQLALAQFKTKHGWEDLPLDSIEPKYEEELRRKRLTENTDGLSDSSSAASDHLPYPSAGMASMPPMIRALMSSPLKAPLYSDAIGSSNGSTGHRKRTYLASFDDDSITSPTKRFRSSPTPHKHNSFPANYHQFTQSSPLKSRRHQHFTTAAGPDVSLFQTSRKASIGELTAATNFAATSSDSDDDDLLPSHSFHVNSTNIVRSSPPRTPLVRNRTIGAKQSKEAGANKSGEEGADLLLYLAQSPSPAVPTGKITAMEPPSTPPSKNLALPSSMMTTPGGSNLFPNTPGQGLDFSEFLKFTPSPARFKTPGTLTATRTPLASSARRRLTFDEPLP